MTSADPQQVGPGLFAVTGTDVNWVIVQEGDDLTLIDAGWSGDTDHVERSIRALGREPRDVAAILLTHAHADHTGAVNHLHDTYGTPVFVQAGELPNALGTAVETGGPKDVAKRLYQPRVARWAVAMIGVGGLRHTTTPAAEPFTQDGPLDLPGGPVPVATPGHTSGHTSYFLPRAGVVVTGDALVTAHPTVRGDGPCLLPPYFTHEQADAVRSLSTLRELDVDTFVPGHGPTWHGPISAAADHALDRLTTVGSA